MLSPKEARMGESCVTEEGSNLSRLCSALTSKLEYLNFKLCKITVRMLYNGILG